ncbi:hypothetical protein HII31_12452 [Pseudocercospora fuligena]|uniref:Chromo domain-containing protein n=1 Tax=Pseudocercospora fuligena TaxID=685502 RepID=A0A8H6R6K3_9PEZI|nr:hypothetical protein HII31_12452 [Pseudocercospora fuligena]
MMVVPRVGHVEPEDGRMDNIRFYIGPGRELSTLPQPVCSLQTMALALTKETPRMPLDSADPPSLAPPETPSVSRETAQDPPTYPEASLLGRTPPSAGGIDDPRRVENPRAVRPLLSPWLERRRRPRVRKRLPGSHQVTSAVAPPARLTRPTHALHCAVNGAKGPSWEVDKIVDYGVWAGKAFYKVRWEDTWEPAANLEMTAADAITEWCEQQNILM